MSTVDIVTEKHELMREEKRALYLLDHPEQVTAQMITVLSRYHAHPGSLPFTIAQIPHFLRGRGSLIDLRVDLNSPEDMNDMRILFEDLPNLHNRIEVLEYFNSVAFIIRSREVMEKRGK